MCDCAPIEKARRPRVSNSTRYRQLRQTGNREDARSKPLAAAMERLLHQMALNEAAKIMQRYGGVVRKSAGDPDQDRKLLDKMIALLRRFGLRHAAETANNTAGQVIIPPSMISDTARGKQAYIQWFYEWRDGAERRAHQITTETRFEMQRVVQDLIVHGQQESPRPSMGEMARRIRNTIMSKDPEGRLYTFSSERAALIARTEIGQSEALGEANGYFALADPNDLLMWLSYQGGGRGHGLMNGKVIRVKHAAGQDQSMWFKLPDGTRMPYPKYFGAPIGHTANCRCGKRIKSRLLSVGAV